MTFKATTLGQRFMEGTSMDTSETHPSHEDLAALIDRIGSHDPEVFMPAAMRLCDMGPPVVAYLIAAADDCITPDHQYRLLDLAQRIGGERGATENRHLRALRRHWRPEIRQKVEEVFAALSPRPRTRKSGATNLVQGAGAIESGKITEAVERLAGAARDEGEEIVSQFQEGLRQLLNLDESVQVLNEALLPHRRS